jgi:monoamine oxidase
MPADAAHAGQIPFTRRDFIARVAGQGGSAYAAMLALGLLTSPPAQRSLKLTGSGRGRRVLILGAGLAGMCAAYELGKLGYDVELLEARGRAGGRCWTVRRGTEETEVGGERQTAAFDEGLYFNPGPARIPQHHRVTLDYCKEFGLAVEVFTNLNDAAYYYQEGTGPLAGRPVRIREAKADLRGYTSELLAKAVRRDDLDRPLTTEDAGRLVDFLRVEGDLSPDLFYRGSGRRGYSTLPGAGPQPGSVDPAFDLGALLQAGFGQHFSQDYAFTQQMTMLQIAGGTDRLAQGFAERLGGRIRYGAEVREIRRTRLGARAVYVENGRTRQADAEFVICAIPLSVLRDIPADLSAEMQQAIRAVGYAPTGKIGLQFSRRFWEEDDRIFGGISRTNTPIAQIWYPSTGYLSPKGILVGYYNFEGDAVRLGSLPPHEREARALAEGRKLHPQYDDTFESSFSVSWHRVRYSLGGWASYSSADRTRHYPVLNAPDGPIYLAGEHLSYLTGWMAGALESAQRVVGTIHARARAGRGN